MRTGPRASDTLWLIRHGDREDFDDPDWGRTASRPHDPGLSALGALQAKRAGARLASAGISRIFTSPYLRCVETAGHIARAVGASVSLEPGLGELQHPDWGPGLSDMLRPSQLEASAHALDATHSPLLHPQRPETIEEAFVRSGRTARALAAANEGPLLLVGHAVSVLGIVRELAGPHGDVPCPVASLFRLERAGNGWTAALVADTSHHDGQAGAVLVTPD